MKKSPELELQVVFSRNARRRQGRGGKASLRQSQVSMTLDHADDASRSALSIGSTLSSPNGGSDARGACSRPCGLCWRVLRCWPPVRHRASPSRCRRVDRSQPARRPSRRPRAPASSSPRPPATPSSTGGPSPSLRATPSPSRTAPAQPSTASSATSPPASTAPHRDRLPLPRQSCRRDDRYDGPHRHGGSFLASTLDVPDADFMKGGDLTFKGASTASVVNYGEIGSLGGDVALIARKVENAGTITARTARRPRRRLRGAGERRRPRRRQVRGQGRRRRHRGEDERQDPGGRGRAARQRGNVYALAGNTDGVVAATGTAKKGGRIFLTAGEGGSVEVSQKVVARSASAAGKAKAVRSASRARRSPSRGRSTPKVTATPAGRSW